MARNLKGLIQFTPHPEIIRGRICIDNKRKLIEISQGVNVESIKEGDTHLVNCNTKGIEDIFSFILIFLQK